ncbi:MAG: methyltransferase, partial [Candidatus Electrothrix sp. AUS1_2]|nr:methyltransferase [Candidatus Electrothrix sp. AUS1_2]
ASLISKSKWKNIRILDAGAGTGILTASAALRCSAIQSVIFFQYENSAMKNFGHSYPASSN